MVDVFVNIPILSFVFTDLFHFLFYVLLISYFFYFKFMDKNLFIFLLILSPSPFIFNNLFFESYFPDTTDYLETLLYHREYVKLHPGYLGDNKILNFTYLLSYFPIPFIFSKVAIGFVSKFIFTILAIYLFKKNKANILLLLLILFTPELIMYTSLGLKEALVIFLMTVTLIQYEQKNFIRSVFFVIPLYFVKFQCFYFIIYFIAIHQFLQLLRLKNYIVLKLIALILLCITAILVLFILNLTVVNEFVLQLDYFCRKLNYNSDNCYTNFRELIFTFDDAIINFVLTPLLNKDLTLLFFTQFLSSSYYILFTILFIYFSTFEIEIKLSSIIYIISLGLLFGLVFVNDGLLTRQKFVLIYPLLCFLFVKTDLRKIFFLYNILNKLKITDLINKELIRRH